MEKTVVFKEEALIERIEASSQNDESFSETVIRLCKERLNIRVYDGTYSIE